MSATTPALSVRRRFTAVLSGGFCGAVTRYLLSMLIQAWLGKGWPYDIFLINLTGALVLAFVTTLADATFLIGPTRRLFINVGFLGAYTTFSSLVLGDVQLFAKGESFLALLYFVLSLLGGVVAIWLGIWLGERFLQLRRHSGTLTLQQSSPGLEAPSWPPDEQLSVEHVDVQDDVRLPDVVDQHERH